MLRSFGFAAMAALALGACDSGADEAVQESAASAGPSYTPRPDQMTGEMSRAFAGTALPAMTVSDPAGNTLDLGSLDQPVLVNLWATWCAPCVVEMPALDALAGELEGEVKVVTISQDSRPELVPAFFEERNFQYLEQWLDPENDLAVAFTESGLLPVTILFDAQGKEVLRVAGGYEWDSEEAVAQLREALAESPS